MTPAPNATPENHGPAAEMSKQLGGMRLGMTVADFAAVCSAKGAKAIPNEPAQSVLCTLPPEPLLSLDGVIVGVFCGPDTTVCELAYVVYGKLSERDEQIHALVGDLTRRYGPPSAVEGSGASDPGRECTAGKAQVHVTRSWSFGPPHPIGRIRLVFDCDPSDKPLTLVYDDARGIARTTAR
jgi:hypothetical protein